MKNTISFPVRVVVRETTDGRWFTLESTCTAPLGEQWERWSNVHFNEWTFDHVYASLEGQGMMVTRTLPKVSRRVRSLLMAAAMADYWRFAGTPKRVSCGMH